MKVRQNKKSIVISEIFNESQYEMVCDCVETAKATSTVTDNCTKVKVVGTNTQLGAFVDAWNEY